MSKLVPLAAVISRFTLQIHPNWPPGLHLHFPLMTSPQLLDHVVRNICFKKIKASKTSVFPPWLALPHSRHAVIPLFSISLANFPRAPRSECRAAKVHKCNYVVSRDLILWPHIDGQLSCMERVEKRIHLPLGLESRLPPRGPAILPESLHRYKGMTSLISNGLEA